MATSSDSATPISRKIQPPILRERSALATDPQSLILDDAWAKQAFLVKTTDMDAIDVQNRSFSTAHLKFLDTTLGGHYAINPKPQFTRYSDIRSKGRAVAREDVGLGKYGKHGMGRYYSEAIDDPSQLIHMRFGVPQYNSLTKFFTGFYNTGAGRLARTGRTSDFLGNVGFAFGLVANIIIWPVMVVHAIGYVARFFFNRPTSKFYYLKPTMFIYWSAVNSLVNKIAVNKGLFPTTQKNNNGDQSINTSFEVDKEMLEQLHSMMPQVFSKDGGYDIMAAANRAERIRIAADNSLYERNNNNNAAATDFFGKVKEEGQSEVKHIEGIGWRAMIQTFLSSDSTSNDTNKDNFEKDIKTDPTADKNNPDKKRGSFDAFWNYLKAELNDGSAFATFRVDYTGSVSESFSNSVRESDIAGKINGLASSARSTSFSFAGGSNIGGAVGSVIDAGTSAIKSFASGALDAVGFSGLLQVAGGSFVDIPKHWDSSSASLPKSSYTIELRSPYGNVISQMQNLYIPLAMLLAAALPLSTGKQSYTSPFILELYDKGRHQTRLGMIDSLQITRGTTNLGFNKDGKAMGIDVSFSVVDMSSVLHMPISQGFMKEAFFGDNGIFDEETVFSDYMSTLASLGLHEQFHRMPRLNLNFARSMRNLESLTSPAAWASFVNDKTPIGALEVFFKGTRR